MNVTLPKDLEEFVLKKAAAGEYPNAAAVVVEALREFQTKVDEETEPGWAHPLPDGKCPPELKALLLEAVRGPHHPMPVHYFDQLRKKLRGSNAK